MAVTEEFIEQVSEALNQLGYSVEQEEDVISDVSQINDEVTLPGIRVQSGTMTGYVSMKLAVLKAYLDNTVQTIQQTWDAWFSDVLPTGVRSIWTTWFGARQTEWDTMSTDVGNATEMAVQAADNADSAAQNAQQKAGVAENKAAIAAEQAQYAKTQGDYAKNLNDHPAYVGEDDYWYLWNVEQQQYIRGEYARGAAATIAVGSVSTLEPNQQATVRNSGTEGAAVFNFGIPRGATGATGQKGDKGDKGDDLDYSTMTEEEKSELNDTIVQHIVSDNILGPTYDEDEHGFNFPKAMHVQYDAVEHGFNL